jgi:hypothetical protein
LSKPSDRSARTLSDEVDAGSAKESASKQRPKDAGLMQSGRIMLWVLKLDRPFKPAQS